MSDNDLSNNGLLLDILKELRVMRSGQQNLEKQITYLSGHKEKIDEIEEKVEKINRVVSSLEYDQKKRSELKMAFMTPAIKTFGGFVIAVFMFSAGSMYTATNEKASSFKVNHNQS